METADCFKEKYEFNNFVVEYSNLISVMGNGGPEVGNVQVSSKKLHGLFGGPPCYDPKNCRLFLTKYITVTKKYLKLFKFTKPRFSVYVLDLSAKLIFESKLNYKLLFIKEIRRNEVQFYEANHDGLLETYRVLEFNETNFDSIGVF